MPFHTALFCASRKPKERGMSNGRQPSADALRSFWWICNSWESDRPVLLFSCFMARWLCPLQPKQGAAQTVPQLPWPILSSWVVSCATDSSLMFGSVSMVCECTGCSCWKTSDCMSSLGSIRRGWNDWRPSIGWVTMALAATFGLNFEGRETRHFVNKELSQRQPARPSERSPSPVGRGALRCRLSFVEPYYNRHHNIFTKLDCVANAEKVLRFFDV